ncbi:1-deoxy-D-xylulose-5-phosphate reductoisomerase [Sporolactobacillus shoreae]|uniref:1-deoxy-D-xylulose 5-phosphate reductoisomerase n=1 Tax=Sporolactobacillus shoreae TaxID=1465501 RepID=A0A4Z0GSG0_9BACL|nr:1-deoxy-D-xylulose-5-phosphate reductoisomerase [Sporolactobacillus shoreae]TGB00313.1 1-deoxy-D-xylulose-5-phosphate reductoisomerase [Sporolactobacillus shoreae]
MKRISLLGATGSVGTQTLSVIREHPDEFSVSAFSFGENIQMALPLIKEFSPKLIAVKNRQTAERIRPMLPGNVKVVYGIEGMIEAAAFPDSDMLVNAVLGSIGLEPTLAAIESRKIIGIANKETLVTAGHLVMKQAKKYDVSVLPIDSEHSAIFQSLQGQDRKALSRLILTASGGVFRDLTRNELENVTVADAVKHPNWSMGAKLTVDTSTMMNKGLEVIEAHWLFDVPYERIDIVIHRESIVHSLVEYHDHSMIAQLGMPSMLVPIQYALSYPSRLELKQTKRLNLWEIGTLHFQKVDTSRYPAVRLAYEAGNAGGSMPTVLNAANESAVDLFLDGRIKFLDIEPLVKNALDHHVLIPSPDLEAIEETDAQTRRFVKSLIN